MSALFLDAILAPNITGNRHGQSAVATNGLYGLLKVWDICIAPLLDGAPLPKYIKSPPTRMSYSNGARRIPTERSLNAKMRWGGCLPHPPVRVGYSADLLSTLRGVSWLDDRHFDFLTSQVVSEQANSYSRREFIRERILHLLLVCLYFDVCDSITKSQSWMKAEDLLQALPDGRVVKTPPLASDYAHRITGQTLLHQMVFVLIVAVTTQLSIETFYTLFALFCVQVFYIIPKLFPYFFGNSTPTPYVVLGCPMASHIPTGLR